MGVKRGSIMILIRSHPSYQEAYDEMFKELQSMPIPVDNSLQLPQSKV